LVMEAILWEQQGFHWESLQPLGVIRIRVLAKKGQWGHILASCIDRFYGDQVTSDGCTIATYMFLEEQWWQTTSYTSY
jgi:hypothetical protein